VSVCLSVYVGVGHKGELCKPAKVALAVFYGCAISSSLGATSFCKGALFSFFEGAPVFVEGGGLCHDTMAQWPVQV